MISTKSLITELTEVPIEWVFEYYLKLSEKLMGQNLMILSPFNPKDKRPSFSLFVSSKDNRSYKYRDFSTGKAGDNVSLVQYLFNLSTRGETAHKIVEDYNKWVLINKDDFNLRDFKVQQRYKVTSFVKRGWTVLDQKYWTKFHIGSKILEHFSVFPLESYEMSRENDGATEQVIVTGRSFIYGYFRVDGTLYKIYQPLVTDYKFIKVRDYIQGTDQLTFQKKYLVICSSLKDMMAFTKLGYKNAEVVAPDSENTLIGDHVISAYRLKYQGICTLFDNDDAGIKAMKKYEDNYGIKSALLPMSKDLSDSIRDNNISKVQEVLTPILKQALQ
tara:strand:+ start:1535 stop:2527 length:993 start_codon:yes stop_codon:yes gene_type:complete